MTLRCDTDIHAAFLGVLKSVGNKRLKDLFDLGHIGIHYRRDRRIHIDDELDILGLILLYVGNDIVKDRREHVVLVVADSLLTVEFRIIENVADLFRDLSSRIPYGYQIAFDFAVPGFIYAKSRKTDDRIYRSP